MDLRVRVLGGFEIEGIESARLGSRKARTLLKVLALSRGRHVTIDHLADCLWREQRSRPARPDQEVRVLISRLRGVLGAERLLHSDSGYALAVDWLDLDALAELVEEARRRITAEGPGLARAAAAAAVALLRGQLLPDELDAQWAEADRALADRLAAAARRTAAEAALASGDLPGAALLGEAALDHDPYDEAALRTLMTALAGSGRPASGLNAYATMRSRLSNDLGVSPTRETETLHTKLLRGEPLELPTAAAAGAGARTTVAGAGARKTVAASLPGRADALSALDEVLGHARAGRGGLAVIEGEAGIGKSRLLSTWATRATSSGATVLTAWCEELDRGLPLQPILRALDDHLRTIGPSEALEALGAEADLLSPLLGRGAVDPAMATGALRDPLGGQLLLFVSLVNVLGRLSAASAPTVLLVDDAHLAGVSTVEWLNYAARRAGELRLMLVLAQRPEEATEFTTATKVQLGPLDEAAAAELVGPDRAAELVARSGGNPLFLVELAAANPADVLPTSVRDTVAARCDRAGPAAAAALRTAAVIGPTVDLDLLAAVLRASPVGLLDHLEQGVRRGLLIEHAEGFAFRHDLIREALAAGTSPSRRTLAHREAGRALAARSRPDPLAVAHHARLGGDNELAARALIEAAAVASSRFDQAEALLLLDQSVTLADSLEARLLRARVLIVTGNYDRAERDVDAARDAGGGSLALELGAWAAHYRRDFATAMRRADEGALVAEDAEQRVACLTIGGWVRQCTSDLPGAAARLEEADQTAEGAWKPVVRVWLGGLRVQEGRCAEGVELISAAHPSDSLGGHGYPALYAAPALHAHLFGALALADLGRAEDALREVDAIDAEAARTGVSRWAGRADNTRGWILRALGESGAADEANARGLERSSAIHMLEPMSHAHLDLASGAMLAGDVDRAKAEIAAARALGNSHAMAWRHVLRANLYQGEIALALGDPAEAHDAATALLAEARRIGTRRYVAFACLLLASARLAAGEAVDLDEVGGHLNALRNVAGLEAWRLTASMAAATRVDPWWTMAQSRVAELAAHAGPHARTLQRVAGATLDKMRTASSKG